MNNRNLKPLIKRAIQAVEDWANNYDYGLDRKKLLEDLRAAFPDEQPINPKLRRTTRLPDGPVPGNPDPFGAPRGHQGATGYMAKQFVVLNSEGQSWTDATGPFDSREEAIGFAETTYGKKTGVNSDDENSPTWEVAELVSPRDQKVEELRALYNKYGGNMTAVGEQLGIGRGAVRRRLVKAGIIQ